MQRSEPGNGGAEGADFRTGGLIVNRSLREIQPFYQLVQSPEQ